MTVCWKSAPAPGTRRPSCQSAARLARLGYTNIEIRHSDGYAGWPEFAPYDGILVTAAAPAMPPPLIEQLKEGCRLVIPIGPRYGRQELVVIEKRLDGSLSKTDVLGVVFVPFVGCGEHGIS